MDGELVSTEAAGVGEFLVTLRALVGFETCRSTAFSQGKKSCRQGGLCVKLTIVDAVHVPFEKTRGCECLGTVQTGEGPKTCKITTEVSGGWFWLK